MIQSILIFLYSYMDIVVPWIVFLLALAVYTQRDKISLRHWSRALILTMLIYYPVYAIISTIAKYEAWMNGTAI